MIAGLVSVTRPTRVRRGLAPLVAAGLLLGAVATTGTAVLTQDGTTSDAELVDRLADIEEQLTIDTFGVDAAGTITSDLVTIQIALEEADPHLQDLVADASRSTTDVANAVENVAGSHRLLLRAVNDLVAYEEGTLVTAPPPLPGQETEAPVLTGADTPRGVLEIGVAGFLEAVAGMQDGYEVLVDAEAAADYRALFEARLADIRALAQEDLAGLRRLLSLPSTHLLVATSRFDPRFSGENPAQVARYACVDRDDYAATRPTGPVGDLPLPTGDVPDLGIPDCPDLQSGNETRLVEPTVVTTPAG